MNILLDTEKALMYLSPGFRPEGWEIMGVVENKGEIGALMQSPSGRYMIGNAHVCKSLDQGKVNEAMTDAMNLDRYQV